MPKRIHPKKLLVEGNEDKRVIPELIEAHGITWGETADEAIVFIEEFEGVSNLLKPGVIEAELKASGVEIVGIMIDANADADGRFNQIRTRCKSQFPHLPTSLPAGGLIHSNEDGLKLGVWLMPDNRSRGMIETFLMYLAPAEDQLVRYAEKACKTAQRLGAPYKSIHLQKAKIHTWLAWQDEPGPQLHQAVKKHVLNSGSPNAVPFVSWFRNLFEV
jgi:hypothetical protein